MFLKFIESDLQIYRTYSNKEWKAQIEIHSKNIKLVRGNKSDRWLSIDILRQ